MKFALFFTLLSIQVFVLPLAYAETVKSWEEYAAKLKWVQRRGFKHSKNERDPADYEGSTNYAFPCQTLESRGTPTTVHQLRPSDVKVVAALGDSITAANGLDAKTVLGVLTQYRGKSWSIGGDQSYESVPTLPNILRKYNPDLVGYSIGAGRASSAGARLNVAVPGGISQDMPDQARKLVDKMREDPNVDFDNDWKVVTLFIGGNDLCRWCNNEEKFAPETYADNIRQALDILHAEVPRTFVNLVSVVRVTQIARVSELICDTLQMFLCECGRFGNEGKLEPIIDEYHRVTDELMTSGRYETRDDFTVVVQPAFKHTEIPEKEGGKIDESYLAPDCFHFSAKGHAAAAESLWNNMIEQVGSKRERWTPGEPVECPTEENPFFYTMLNSPPGLMHSKSGYGETKERTWDQMIPIFSSSFNSSRERCMLLGGTILAVVVVMACITTLALVRIRAKRRSRLHQKEKELMTNY
ncbi:phospholipase B1, membrane-associated-like [Ptychodera flava]|uniref:phospholipase B1, membrane-associated-like n=1 Tax=Ptychodera flava TaxID=63121 RepID=UPI003969CFE6